MKQSLFILFVLGLGACFGQKTLDKEVLHRRLDSLLEQEHTLDRFHGTFVLSHKNSPLYSKSIGLANRGWQIPMSLNTRFDIASLNKSFIAALWVIAEEEGKVSLDCKLNALLQRFNYQASFDSTITIHQMITHTSGLPNYDALPPELKQNNYQAFKSKRYGRQEYMQLIGSLAPAAKPTTVFHYSNFAYHILAFLLEDLYERPFNDLLQEKICIPLGLQHTLSCIDNQQLIPKLAEGYNYTNGAWLKNNYIDLSQGRKIFSTAQDLQRWANAFCDTSFFDKAQLELICSNRLSQISSEISYGYGWAVHPENSPYSFGDLNLTKPYLIHGGATEGYRSLVVIVNNGTFILSFLSNVGHNTNELALAKEIFKILNLYDEP